MNKLTSLVITSVLAGASIELGSQAAKIAIHEAKKSSKKNHHHHKHHKTHDKKEDQEQQAQTAVA